MQPRPASKAGVALLVVGVMLMCPFGLVMLLGLSRPGGLDIMMREAAIWPVATFFIGVVGFAFAVAGFVRHRN